MAQSRKFYCLRCQHRFLVEYDPKLAAERSCPKCGSNSVRLESPIARASLADAKTQE
jgi:Zn finger protein HypA/HybF involved in hydrogenase expression